MQHTTPNRLLALFLVFFVGSLHTAFAQQTLRFKAQTKKQQPIGFASFEITQFADSSKVIKKVADSSGVIEVKLAAKTQYSVKITAVGYLELNKGVTIADGATNYNFSLQEEPKSLGTVVVKSKKPLMRQEDDKTIVDPENLALASTNAYEVIEKTPGVFVDQDGNVYLNGSSPSVIQINGREMRMSAQDVATILKSLPPNSIEKIEIIRTPSAKYDASGGGGIVNIVLKKGVKIGLTGSVYAGFRQGKLGNQFVGFSVSNNNEGNSQYVNVQFRNAKNYDLLNTDRLFSADSVIAQSAYTELPEQSFFVGYGFSWARHKKWSVDYDGRISYSSSTPNTSNNNFFKKLSTGTVFNSNTNTTQNDGRNFNLNQGLSAKYKMDSLGSEWTIDLSYNHSRNKTGQNYGLFAQNSGTSIFSGFGENNSTRHFIDAKTDLKWKPEKSLTLETGIKASLMRYESDADYYRKGFSFSVKDNFRTNKFEYDENINAAYVQASKSFGDLVLKAGLRMENTNMTGRQLVPGDTTFKVNRTDFFPYVYLSKNVARIFGFDLRAYAIYRRTLSRPGYGQLNPFRRYVDQYLFEAGNPALQPQFTQNVELNISFEDFPILAVGFNETKDIFASVTYQVDSSKTLAYRTYDNLGKNKEFYMRFAGGIPPGGKFFFYIVAEYNHNFYEGVYENRPLSFKRGSWNIFTYQSLKLDAVTQIGLNGFVRFNGLAGFYEQSNFGGIGLNISRQFFNKKLTVNLVGSDILFTSNNQFAIQQGSLSATGYRESDSRRFGLNLRYNFGVRKKEESQTPNVLESPEKSN
jgi:iron complex outermembrane recepter protein